MCFVRASICNLGPCPKSGSVVCASGRSQKPSLSSPDYAGSSLAVHCLCLPCRSYICHPGSSRSLPSFCEGPSCSCALRFEHTSAESVTGKKLLLPLTSPGTMGVFRIPISPQTPAQDSVSQFGGGMWSRKRRHGQKRSREEIRHIRKFPGKDLRGPSRVLC